MPLPGRGAEPLGDDRLRVTSVADDGLLHVTLRLPCVLAVGNAVVSRLRVPTLTQRLVGRAEELAVLSPGDVGVDLEHELGREGRILTGVATVDRARHGVVIHGARPQDKAQTLFDAHLKSRIEAP